MAQAHWMALTLVLFSLVALVLVFAADRPGLRGPAPPLR